MSDSRPPIRFTAPHLFGIDSLDDEALSAILKLSQYYAALRKTGQPIPKRLTGKTQINLFFENSTRTNCSFELAGKKLGADVIGVPVAASSVHKGEELKDTVQTLAAMGADAMVIRNAAADTSRFIADALTTAGISTAILNAGEGTKAHPTQALLDAATMLEAFEIDANAPPETLLQGRTITICGDIRHSRVAGSNAALLPRLGATVRFVAPPDLLPAPDQFPSVHSFTNLEEGMADADIVMCLRMQFERMPPELKLDGPSYYEQFGLTHQRLQQLAPQAKVMHPGPMNRGIEIAGNLADDPAYSLILKQVGHGVTMRMALLDALLTETSQPE